jgi:hypothetical protein
MVEPTSPSRLPRRLASAAVLAAAATFVFAQIDFARRHRIGIAPERYWWPQLGQIWLPGLALATTLAVLALVLHRRGRRA